MEAGVRGFLIGCAVGAFGMFVLIGVAEELLDREQAAQMATWAADGVHPHPATVEAQVAIGQPVASWPMPDGLIAGGGPVIPSDVHMNAELFPAAPMDQPHYLATCDRFSPEALDQLRDIAK
jgi:hypothetical protein